MFPDFHYLFRSLFGINIPALSIVKTFGFCVALAFIGGAIVLRKELQRKKEEGLFEPEIVSETVGLPATPKELFWLFVIGFIVGFKVLGLVINAGKIADPAAYIFSASGIWWGGLIIGGILVYLRYSNKKKKQKKKPITQKFKVYPHNRVWDIIFIAAVFGFIGAKIFNALETWQYFIQDPIGSLLSPSGLTFYGGLIFATAALYWYSRKKKFSFRQLCDAAAPALILAYALGRFGCQLAGDGDWGIYNSAYITNPQTTALQPATPKDFDNTVQKYPNAFTEFGNPPEVPHLHVSGPSWLPAWMIAQNYRHNINRQGIRISGFNGEYDHVLPVAVFPTPMYEIVACLIIFLILWRIRRKFKYPLQLFSIYLIFNGIERFLVELIRVNTRYDLGFMHPTQAELISSGLIITGIIMFFVVKKRGEAGRLKGYPAKK